jgi:hypothetical protein
VFTKSLQGILNEIIGKTFNSLRFNLLGPDRVSKAYVLSLDGSKYNPSTTLAAAYMQANSANTTNASSIDKKTIQMLVDVSVGYIDSLEEKTSSDVNRVLTQHIAQIEQLAKIQQKTAREVLLGSEGEEIIGKMKSDLKDLKKKIDQSAEMLSEHQRYNAANYGAADGILAAAKSIGISDPTVIKIGIVDEKLSDMCEHLWHTQGNIVKPKAYKLSELKGGEGNPKKGMWEPTLGLSHINCRHVLVTVMPGFGLDDNGKIVYKGKDDNGNLYDEYTAQRK